MAYTDSTLNYQIPLPQANDTFNPLDWNESAEKIDTAIHNASQIADTARDDLVKVKKEVVNLQTGLGETDDRATALTARVGVLEQNDNTYAEGIKDLGDMFTAREVQQAQSDVEIGVGKWFRYNGVLYVCTVEIKVGDTIVPNVNCRATNVESEMPTGSGGLSDRIETLEAEDVLMKNRMTAVEKSASDSKTLLGNSSIAGIGDGTVTSAINTIDNEVHSSETGIEALLARVEALEKGGGMIPDYSKSVSIERGTSYVVPSRGILVVTAGGRTAPTITINNTAFVGGTTGNDIISMFNTFNVDTGDSISISSYEYNGSTIFVPYK